MNKFVKYVGRLSNSQDFELKVIPELYLSLFFRQLFHIWTKANVESLV